MLDTGQVRVVLSAALLLFLVLACHPRPLNAADTEETAGSVLRVLIPAVAYGTTFNLDAQAGGLKDPAERGGR